MFEAGVVDEATAVAAHWVEEDRRRVRTLLISQADEAFTCHILCALDISCTDDKCDHCGVLSSLLIIPRRGLGVVCGPSVGCDKKGPGMIETRAAVMKRTE